ncbi:hypothetical protein [Burkholderia perseverans]|uniref:hypothetical protein n=1 Tax=Burkholderia perseverans TaxID=2615214 RepID=UPI001FEE50F1|nr:hypothetical protein [Burkholderia perseverans]
MCNKPLRRVGGDPGDRKNRRARSRRRAGNDGRDAARQVEIGRENDVERSIRCTVRTQNIFCTDLGRPRSRSLDHRRRRAMNGRPPGERN